MRGGQERAEMGMVYKWWERAGKVAGMRRERESMYQSSAKRRANDFGRARGARL